MTNKELNEFEKLSQKKAPSAVEQRRLQVLQQKAFACADAIDSGRAIARAEARMTR